MTEADAYLTLNLIKGIGPTIGRRLVERFGSALGALAASPRELEGVPHVGRDLADAIATAHRNPQTDAAAERERAVAKGLTILTQADDDYPATLREIYDPPLVLYAQGTVPKPWPRGLAVVGSRKTSHYGIETTKKLSYQCAYAGVPIVSGLARGIDTTAHTAALAAKGVTWAVVACGLDHMYPPENQALADRIAAERGCVLSEFPLAVPPDRSNFPRRNRIVSGLSFGVLVVEAGRDSGALITAHQAQEQGRDVFAVPGRIDNPQSAGCHQLIKAGAKLVEGADDVLSEVQFSLKLEEVTVERPAPPELKPDEQTIFEAIGLEEMPIDELIRKTGLPSGTVSSTLLRLEMKRLVRQLPGKVFVRTA